MVDPASIARGLRPRSAQRLAAAMILVGLAGCSDPRPPTLDAAPDRPADASAASDLAGSLDVQALDRPAHDARDATDAEPSVDTGDPRDASDAASADSEGDAGHAADASDAGDLGDASDANDAAEVGDANDAAEVGDAADASDAAEVGDAADASDAGDAGDVRDADAGAAIDPDAGRPTVETLVAAGAVWRYLDRGAAPGASWVRADYDDADWRAGDAQLGYGDDDEATAVSFGPSASNKYVTTHFRRAFRLTDAAAVRRLTLRLLRDDGAAVFLNGREVVRANLPSGALTHRTLASTTVSDAAESTFYTSVLDPADLVEGVNQLAVEVHQVAVDSSDVSFDLELLASRVDAPIVVDAGADTSVALADPVVPPVESGSDPVIVAAGDISRCDNDFDEATARLVDRIPGTVLLLGDTVYQDGTDLEFASCFAPTWGRHRARTRPAVGNHEYQTARAAGYYRYFGAAAGDPAEGWYAFDLGAWRLLALNSNCAEVGGCGAGSPQERWVRAELAAHPARCALAYWHHPRFSSGPHGSPTEMSALWRALDEGGADVILTGHDHHYERFAPQDADGAASPDGPRQFVVGTGGALLRPLVRRLANSEAASARVHGVLRVVLRPTSYAWDFVPIAGDRFVDNGSADCR